MALKRSDLNKILNAFKTEDETLEGSTKALLDLFHAEIDSEKDKYDELSKQFEEYKGSHKGTGEDAEEWKSKYEKERDDFKAYKTEQTAKADKAAKADKYKALLKEVGVSDKRFDAILKVTDLDSIKLKDGEIEDKDKLKEAIKSDWADFITKTEQGGASTPNPSNNSGSKMTKEEIVKIKDATERQQAIADNHELFGF